MRIIKQGKDPQIVEYENGCSKCETVFVYVQKETQADRDGRYVICPCCGTFIAHSTSIVYKEQKELPEMAEVVETVVPKAVKSKQKQA